jgi:hypothetical protein
VQINCLDIHSKALTGPREHSPGVLSISPEINAQHTAISISIQKPAYAIGIIIYVHAAAPRTSAFRKDQQVLLLFQEIMATFHQFFHLFAVSSPVNRNTLGHITQNRQEDILLEIIPFGHVPGKEPIVEHVPPQRKHRIDDNSRIHHSQMVGADQPWTFMTDHLCSTLLPETAQIANAVTSKPKKSKIEGRQQKDGHPAEEILQLQPRFN